MRFWASFMAMVAWPCAPNGWFGRGQAGKRVRNYRTAARFSLKTWLRLALMLVFAAVLTLWSMVAYLQAAWPELRRSNGP